MRLLYSIYLGTIIHIGNCPRPRNVQPGERGGREEEREEAAGEKGKEEETK